MRHRPEYINASAPYVRPALYVPPSQALLLGEPAQPISRWGASWRALAYLVGVLVALGIMLAMFAYGVIAIRKAYVGQHHQQRSSWVAPTTYGPPGPNGGPR